MAIATPMFMIGFKDNDTGLNGEELLKKHIEINILMKMLFSKGTNIYKKLYDMGLINSTFSLDYTMQPDYGFATLDGESNEPEKTYEIILEEIEKLKSSGLERDDFERAKKVIWGRYIRMHNDIEDYACTFMLFLFMGIDYFNFSDVYKTVTFEDVEKRFKLLFDSEFSALSVINPIERKS